jgi:hypothetical protein
MGRVAPFRDGVEDDTGVDEPSYDYANENKPEKWANNAMSASRFTEEVAE